MLRCITMQKSATVRDFLHMFEAMALSPAFSFDHWAQLPLPEPSCEWSNLHVQTGRTFMWTTRFLSLLTADYIFGTLRRSVTTSPPRRVDPTTYLNSGGSTARNWCSLSLSSTFLPPDGKHPEEQEGSPSNGKQELGVPFLLIDEAW